jgi:release factor glutamine methyltransferase
VSDELDVTEALERGTTRFMGLELEVAAGALVARPETELLGEEAGRLLGQLPAGARAVDVCCGSGNLACALAHRVPSARVWACDLTTPCVELARRNARRLGVAVEVLQGDLLGALAGLGLEGTLDLVVCNPPYISSGKLEKERGALLAHEPRAAFDGGPYGLSIHARVIKEALPFLKPEGYLLFEFGLGQERQLDLLFQRSKAYGPLRLITNAQGAPRAAVARRRP